ncbi:MAG TPA: peptidase S41, partial [Bacteroidales bacterium]|nr:peptidase S41 [Bacteroidales bacterium]
MVKRFISKTTIIIALLISFSSANIYSQNTSNLSIYKLIRFIQYVSSEYVDTVSSERIVDDAIIGTLKKLDPHSVYITKEDVKAMNEPLEGNFEGIGVEFNILNDTLIVVNPI